MFAKLRAYLLLVLLAIAPLPEAVAKVRIHAAPSRGPTEQLFVDIVERRIRAIEATFGAVLGDSLGEVEIAIVRTRVLAARGAEISDYDPSDNRLMFDRSLLSLIREDMETVASKYWWFYERRELQEPFTLIGILDDALWNALLEELAVTHQLSWPHEGCSSSTLSDRLGCEMLAGGIWANLKGPLNRIYNENRLEELWPIDLTSLEDRAWRRDDPQYHDVRVLGGLHLIRPLIREFGVGRVLAYVAQTPFKIEDNNVRQSALIYQARARSALDW